MSVFAVFVLFVFFGVSLFSEPFPTEPALTGVNFGLRQLAVSVPRVSFRRLLLIAVRLIATVNRIYTPEIHHS